MYDRLVFIIFILLAFNQTTIASQRSFGYEVTPHDNVPVAAVPAAIPAPAIAAVNPAAIDYDYQKAYNVTQGIGGAAAVPLLPLTQGPSVIGVSLSAGGGGAWDDHQINLNNMMVGAANLPALQDLCRMVVERDQRGINVSFAQGLAAIQAAALGGALPAGINLSLTRGGYKMPFAVALHRLLHHPVQPNYLVLANGAIATQVVIHLHSQRRVSKNVKDVTFNSFLMGGGLVTIKSLINMQYAGIAPVPESATVITYDYTQID